MLPISCTLLLLAASLAGGVERRMPPRDLTATGGGERLRLLPMPGGRSLTRTYRKAVPDQHLELEGYRIPDKDIEDNEISPMEASRLLLAKTILQQSWPQVDAENSSGRRRRIARSATRTEYGRRASNLRGGRVLIVRGRNTRRTQYRRGTGGFKGG